jgi:hypothetical protein
VPAWHCARSGQVREPLGLRAATVAADVLQGETCWVIVRRVGAPVWRGYGGAAKDEDSLWLERGLVGQFGVQGGRVGSGVQPSADLGHCGGVGLGWGCTQRGGKGKGEGWKPVVRRRGCASRSAAGSSRATLRPGPRAPCPGGRRNPVSWLSSRFAKCSDRARRGNMSRW